AWQVRISNSGVVVGAYYPGSIPGVTHAFVWRDLNGNHNYTDDTTDPGERQDLHLLLPTDPLGQSRATAVIDRTSAVPHLQIVVNAGRAGCGSCFSAFVLTDWNDDHNFDMGEATPLASYGGDTEAAAINDAGKVAGNSLPTGGSGFITGDAVIWQVSNNGESP